MAELPPHVAPLLSLQQNESVITFWDGLYLGDVTSGRAEGAAGVGLVVLTNFRVLGFRVWGVFNKKAQGVLDRDLRSIPPPRLFGGKHYKGISVGGMSFTFVQSDADAQAMFDEISFARSRVLPPDAPVASAQGTGASERNVIIKEVIKIPCSFCGTLNLQYELKCITCGAPTRTR